MCNFQLEPSPAHLLRQHIFGRARAGRFQHEHAMRMDSLFTNKNQLIFLRTDKTGSVRFSFVSLAKIGWFEFEFLKIEEK
jgi:hypothetical protein